MTLNQLRGWMYRSARVLGDVQAVEKAAKTGSMKPIEKRLERRVLGRAAGRAIRRATR